MLMAKQLASKQKQKKEEELRKLAVQAKEERARGNREEAPAAPAVDRYGQVAAPRTSTAAVWSAPDVRCSRSQTEAGVSSCGQLYTSSAPPNFPPPPGARRFATRRVSGGVHSYK